MTSAGAEIVSAHVSPATRPRASRSNSSPRTTRPRLEGSPMSRSSGTTRRFLSRASRSRRSPTGLAVPLENGAVVSLDQGARDPRSRFARRARTERRSSASTCSTRHRTSSARASGLAPAVSPLFDRSGGGLVRVFDRPRSTWPKTSPRSACRFGLAMSTTGKRGAISMSSSRGRSHWAALQVKYFTVALMAPTPAGGEARLEGRKTDGFMTASIDLPASERQGRVRPGRRYLHGTHRFRRAEGAGDGGSRKTSIWGTSICDR